jgi:transcription termination factor NusB
MKKDLEFWDHKYEKNYKYIIGGLLFVVIFIGLGSFAYAKFIHKPDVQPKQVPIQLDNSSIVDKESKTAASAALPVSTQPSQISNNTSESVIKPYPSQSTEIAPVDTTQTAQANAQKALDDANKLAEQQAQAAAARLAKIQQCNDYNAQRDAVINPVKQQISDLQAYYATIPSIMAQRVKGTLTTQSQLDNMIQNEANKTQQQINQLQSQLNQLYSQYPLCTP